MWGEIEKILKRKAAEGVDVRLIYDDMSCVHGLANKRIDKHTERGIKICAFNPLRPFISLEQNNRDHRKIVHVDGKVAFTGGINIADEYINAIHRFAD